MSKYIDVDVFIKSFREALPGLKAQVDPDLTPKAYAYLRGGVVGNTEGECPYKGV